MLPSVSKNTKKNIYTLGPLIHNRQVIETLREKNIRSVNDPAEIKENSAILVIRAHGVPPALEAEMRAVVDLAGPARDSYTTMLTYHMGWSDAEGNPVQGQGGKRVRPLLCLLACEAAGGDSVELEDDLGHAEHFTAIARSPIGAV